MNIGLFGGSFNPPHMGHSIVCFYLLETTTLDAIWLIPTFRHAFAKSLAPYDDRVQMCRGLAEPFGGRVEICDLERARAHVSYTIDTVRELHARYPEHSFEWVIGADILEETSRWKDFDTLKKLIVFRVVGRQGFSSPTSLEMPEISSTEVRRRVRMDEPISHLVPGRVVAHIRRTGLYRCNEPARDLK